MLYQIHSQPILDYLSTNSDSMHTSIKVQLATEISSRISSRSTARNLFSQIPVDIESFIIDFEGVIFISRSFASQYLLEKEKLISRNINFSEINLPPQVKEMVKIVAAQHANSNSQRKNVLFRKVNDLSELGALIPC